MDIQTTAQVMGNVGEFIGSVVVLGTLVYLAIQVGQSKKLLEENRRISLSQTYGMRTEYRLDWHARQLSSDLAEIMVKLDWTYVPRTVPANEASGIYTSRIERLTPIERFKLRNLMAMQVHQIDHTLYQASLGLLDSAFSAPLAGTVERLYPLWEKLGLDIPIRVGDYYDELAKPGPERDS